jgi:hypothetical protein
VTGLARNGSGSLGLALAGGGLLLVALVEVFQPVSGPGLYDGVVPEEPYRYVTPAAGQAGSPTSAETTLDASSGTSPAIVLVTTEQPPQAQLIATPGAIALSPGSSTLTASVTPVEASSAQAAAATIYGNVYRYSVVDQAGNALGLTSGSQPTVVLRAPFGAPSVTIAHWDGQTWQPLATGTGALPTILTAPVSALGDYALIPGGGGLSLPVLVALGILAAGIIGVLLLFVRRPRRSRRRSQGKRGGSRT